MTKLGESSSHPVKLGGHPLSPDDAGQHVLAVAAHVVLDAASLARPQSHGLETRHHRLVHAPSSLQSWSPL